MLTARLLTYTYVRTHLHIYIHTFTYVHAYIHIYVHTYIHIHTYTHILHTYVHTYIHIRIHTYKHTYINEYTHTTYIYLFICLFICIIYYLTTHSNRFIGEGNTFNEKKQQAWRARRHDIQTNLGDLTLFSSLLLFAVWNMRSLNMQSEGN